MVNNNKWGFGVIVSLIVISLGIFLLVFLRATGHRYGKVSKVSSYLSGTLGDVLT